MHLNTNIGEVDIPAPWMALFNIVAVLLFVQLLEKLIYPCLLKRGYFFPTSWRIILGIVLAGCSMLCGKCLRCCDLQLVRLFTFYCKEENNWKK